LLQNMKVELKQNKICVGPVKRVVSTRHSCAYNALNWSLQQPAFASSKHTCSDIQHRCPRIITKNSCNTTNLYAPCSAYLCFNSVSQNNWTTYFTCLHGKVSSSLISHLLTIWKLRLHSAHHKRVYWFTR
jgi:hypothetical protein